MNFIFPKGKTSTGQTNEFFPNGFQTTAQKKLHCSSVSAGFIFAYLSPPSCTYQREIKPHHINYINCPYYIIFKIRVNRCKCKLIKCKTFFSSAVVLYK